MEHLHTTEDFISNEYFQQWVLENDPEAERYWQQWSRRHPEKKAAIEEARQIVLSLNFNEDLPEEERFHRVWQKIQAENHASANSPAIDQRSRSRRFIGLKVAAAAALLVIAGLAVFNLWQTPAEYITYTTNYGETHQLILPDSSVVMLNANSSVRYPVAWNDTKREVWLEGEAFFEVTKKLVNEESSQKAKFLVHTSQLDVEVLGTAFNVNTRREKTAVVLNHGSVNLNFKNNKAQQNLLMQPGELVEYISPERQLTHVHVDTLMYTSWVTNKLIFKDQTLEEIAIVLEDNFGYEINFADSSIAQEEFTASIAKEDVELLFPMLSRAFDLEMERNQQSINFYYK